MVRQASLAQLFFLCTVCPTGSLQTPCKHKELDLVFCSTFKPITLTPGAVTQRNEVPMLHDTASSFNLPSLYICLASNVLHASCEGTGLQPCPTALDSARELWLTAGMELATAAGFMRSTSGGKGVQTTQTNFQAKIPTFETP